MMRAAIWHADGRVSDVVEATDPAALDALVAAMGAAGWITTDLPTPWLTHRVDGAQLLLPRPVPPAPPALLAGQTAVWSGLGPGALVTITDPLTGIVAATGDVDNNGAITLSLPSGPWRIDVGEAFPFRPATFDVEVAP